jgi:hypothetical protein
MASVPTSIEHPHQARWPPAECGEQLPISANGPVFALLLAPLTVGLLAGSVVFRETALGDAWLRKALHCDARVPVEPKPYDPGLKQTCRRSLCMDTATGWPVTLELIFVALAILGKMAATALTPLAWRHKRPRRAARLSAASQRVDGLAAASHRQPLGLTTEFVRRRRIRDRGPLAS